MVEIFRQLGEQDRHTLLQFGEFLAREGECPAAAERAPLEPERLPRPKGESVVHAIKRLSRSYYMLDRSRMLTETSALMAAHVLNGRPAEEVIVELEALFARYYAEYLERSES
jgi:hypothetical protein